MPEGDGGEAGVAASMGSARRLEPALYENRAWESLPALLHDARNMVSALELYCDLLEEPGVLSAAHRHYAEELRRLGAANRRLLEALARMGPAGSEGERNRAADSAAPSLVARLRSRWHADREALPAKLPSFGGGAEAAATPVLVRGGSRRAFVSERTVENLAEELRANRNLLAAMVGHAVTLGMSIRGGARPIAMTGDDLTRVLVNLARNAAEAMPGGGHLQIALEEGPEFLTLSFADNGPGIPEHALESIFSPGYTTHIPLELDAEDAVCAWPAQHRGLGLSIVRSLVSAAGGSVWASNRGGGRNGAGELPGVTEGVAREVAQAGCSPPRGAVFLIEFPCHRAGKMGGKLAGSAMGSGLA